MDEPEKLDEATVAKLARQHLRELARRYYPLALGAGFLALVVTMFPSTSSHQPAVPLAFRPTSGYTGTTTPAGFSRSTGSNSSLSPSSQQSAPSLGSAFAPYGAISNQYGTSYPSSGANGSSDSSDTPVQASSTGSSPTSTGSSSGSSPPKPPQPAAQSPCPVQVQQLPTSALPATLIQAINTACASIHDKSPGSAPGSAAQPGKMAPELALPEGRLLSPSLTRAISEMAASGENVEVILVPSPSATSSPAATQTLRGWLKAVAKSLPHNITVAAGVAEPRSAATGPQLAGEAAAVLVAASTIHSYLGDRFTVGIAFLSTKSSPGYAQLWSVIEGSGYSVLSSGSSTSS
ncbi:MAG: hypothetical protein M1115_08570 [Actinobacteria bacterium]|nr:hypothetical protein [Actinomycetota bacterium]